MVTVTRPIFAHFIARPDETHRGRIGVTPHRIQSITMKNDPLFKFVAVILIAGLFAAAFNADPVAHAQKRIESNTPHITDGAQ